MQTLINYKVILQREYVVTSEVIELKPSSRIMPAKIRHQTLRSRPTQYGWRKTFFIILPVPDIGKG